MSSIKLELLTMFLIMVTKLTQDAEKVQCFRERSDCLDKSRKTIWRDSPLVPQRVKNNPHSKATYNIRILYVGIFCYIRINYIYLRWDGPLNYIGSR